jgi:2,3-bisphosphoglycerate-independent phosphoglycerate mutase
VGKAILIILDGWGINPDPKVSAIEAAHTPYFDHLWSTYPHSTLVTHGESVGLPDGQMGNSEVGHLNIGAGRIIYQDLARIHKSIRENELESNPVLQRTLGSLQGRLHLIGLVSDGGVHSHIDHLIALARESRKKFAGDIFIHAFTDGRDVDPRSGLGFLQYLQSQMDPLDIQVVSVIGRYYAMDRDRRWERTKLAYDLLVRGAGIRTVDILSAVEDSYKEGVTDEFIKPIAKTDHIGKPIGRIEPGDAVLFFNFRTDRPRQLTEVLTQKAYPEHDMAPLDIHMVTMTRYDNTFKGIECLFEDTDISMTLGEYLSSLHKTQLRIAETEKYPHVSYFFSGGREEPFAGEERILVPSPKVPTYDLLPEMSAPGVCKATMEFIQTHQPDFICLNFANADMVGHTGVFSAAVKATETVDQCLQELVPICLSNGYYIIIIADHGNADIMINPDGSPNTAHTKNPVPFLYVANEIKNISAENGILADIAPTILKLMDLPVPEIMTGKVLIHN